MKGGSRWGIENGLSGAERGVGVRRDDREAGNETDNEDNENNENDEEEEEEEGEGPYVPFQCPGKPLDDFLRVMYFSIKPQRAVADLVPIFEETISNSTRMQLYCTQFQSFWSSRGP